MTFVENTVDIARAEKLRAAIHLALLLVKNQVEFGPPPDLYICALVATSIHCRDFERWEIEDALQDAWADWGRRSDLPDYPVRHPIFRADNAYTFVRNGWDRETRYGQDRRSLLTHLIKKFEG
jgi:hypothetical protein